MRRRAIVRKGLAPVAGLALVAGLLTSVTALPATGSAPGPALTAGLVALLVGLLLLTLRRTRELRKN